MHSFLVPGKIPGTRGNSRVFPQIESQSRVSGSRVFFREKVRKTFEKHGKSIPKPLKLKGISKLCTSNPQKFSPAARNNFFLNFKMILRSSPGYFSETLLSPGYPIPGYFKSTEETMSKSQGKWTSVHFSLHGVGMGGAFQDSNPPSQNEKHCLWLLRV